MKRALAFPTKGAVNAFCEFRTAIKKPIIYV